MEPKEVQEDEKEILIDYYVQKVSGRLRQLVSPNDNDMKRWVWELFQNAKDSIVGSSSKSVDIIIEISEEKVVFQHNGKPFTPKALNSLIWQKSGEKRGNAESTGRFGTGFLTTHSLSQTVKLETGLIESDGKEWTAVLTLHREGESDDELKEGIFKTLKSRKWLPEKNQWTSFTYFLKNDSNKLCAKAGVESLMLNISYNLAFTPEINQVTITEESGTSIFKRKSERIITPQLKIVEFIKSYGKEKTKINVIVSHSEEFNDGLTKKFQQDRNLRVSAAIVLDGATNTIIPIEKKNPYLYCVFPLIGSEKFHFPVILNSPDFEPTTERDKLLLLGPEHDSEKDIITNSGVNKHILLKGVELFKNILQYVSEENVLDAHYLAKTAIPDDIEAKWFQENIQLPMRMEILETKLVIPAVGNDKLKPNETFFPVYKKDKYNEFWDLCKVLIGARIPRLEDAEIWKDILKSDDNWCDVKLKFTLEDLLLCIETEQTLDKFKEEYFTGDESNAIEYLSKAISFAETDDQQLLNHKDVPMYIFPNQLGNFVEKQQLYKDINIPEPIKDVLHTMGIPWRSILLRVEFDDVFESTNERTIKDASNRIKSLYERYLANKLTAPELEKVENIKSSMFDLLSIAPTEVSEFHTQLFKIAKTIFPDRLSEELNLIDSDDEFDWSLCYQCVIKEVLKEVSSFQNLNGLANHLFNVDYPESDDKLSIRFKTDEFLNDLIQFTFQFNKNYLEVFPIIPNQLYDFCKFDNHIFNDVYDKIAFDKLADPEKYNEVIPSTLKTILLAFGKECKSELLHDGVFLKLNDSHDLKWICSQLDDLVIPYRNNPNPEEEIKQAIRDLDKWIISNFPNNSDEARNLFGKFYPIRHSIVLNTYSNEERNQVDEILKSGKSADFAKIAIAISKVGDKDLMQILVERADKEVERVEREERNRMLGAVVEHLFAEILGKMSNVETVKEDNGQDFLLLNALLEVGLRVEIKSRSKKGEFVEMTTNQVRTAVSDSNKYILCVFPDITNPTEESFKLNSRFIMDSGELLKGKFDEANNFVKSNFTEAENELIQIDFEEKKYKFKIRKKIWDNKARMDENKVLNFMQFIEFVNQLKLQSI